MLDMKFVRENPDKVMQAVANRNGKLDLTEFLELDKKRRELTQQVEALKKERNTASQEIGKLKKAGAQHGLAGRWQLEKSGRRCNRKNGCCTRIR